MPGKIYPLEKEKLLEILSKEDLEIIQKDYPFKHLRNEKIREITQKGASYQVLADLSGISQSQVWVIGNFSKDVRKLNNDALSLKNDLNKIQEAAAAFNKETRKMQETATAFNMEIKKILKHRRK